MGINVKNSSGKIKVSDDVIMSIVSAATIDIDGVSDFYSGNVVSNILKNTQEKGIKVSTEDHHSLILDLYIIVKYGVNIPDVAWNIQEKVKKEIESVIEIKVKAINIHVQGIDTV